MTIDLGFTLGGDRWSLILLSGTFLRAGGTRKRRGMMGGQYSRIWENRKLRCRRYPCQQIITPERILLVHVIKSEVKSFSDVTIVKHALLLGEEKSKQVATIHDDRRLKGNHGSSSPPKSGLFVEQKEENF